MSKKILIIDDEEDVVEIIKTTLKTKGYQTIHAYDGEEGLKQALDNLPDLIILDLMMPKMSGLELSKRLRKEDRTKDIPIICMSAIGKESGKSEEFWRSGLKVHEFLSKPFDTFDLLGRVETIFRSKDYVSIKHAAEVGGGEGEGEAGPEGDTISIDLKIAPPAEVVKAFIEAWNYRDFGLEYDCMGDQIQVMDKLDYVKNRTQTWLDEKAANVTQHVVEVIEENISDNTATVSIRRKDTRQGKSRLSSQQYILHSTPNGWRISQMKSLK